MESGEDQRIDLQKKLIKACRNNDKRAQLKLYKQYSKAMYNVSLTFVNNSVVAEELMHEAFISAFFNISTFKGEVSFGSWLKKITVNKCIDFLKKKKVIFENIDDYKALPVESDTEENERFINYSAEKIKETIQTLPSGYRTIVSLYLFEGYDHQEIAQILGISSSTSRSQYTRAKAILKKKLKEKG